MAKGLSKKQRRRASDLRYEIKKIYKQAGYEENYAKQEARRIVENISPRKLKSTKPMQVVESRVKEERKLLKESKKEFEKALKKDRQTRQERYERIRKEQEEAKREWYGIGRLAYERLRDEISNFPSVAEPIIGGWLDKMLGEYSEEEIGNAIANAMAEGKVFSREIAYNQEALIALTGAFAEFLNYEMSIEEYADVSDATDSYDGELF